MEYLSTVNMSDEVGKIVSSIGTISISYDYSEDGTDVIFLICETRKWSELSLKDIVDKAKKQKSAVDSKRVRASSVKTKLDKMLNKKI